MSPGSRARRRRWWWALALRCPWCGGRGIIRRLRLVERCPHCGLATERAPGQWIGAIGLNTIVSFTALFVLLGVSVIVSWPDAPGVWWLVAGLGTAVLAPVVLLPWARVGWLAIDVRMSPPDPSETAVGGDEDPHRR
ncbi:MAG: DUF983 domain-containing protein [Acidimicrobiia bacterium]|nr:DUF983 domain-containing protein [Acidimicrobiia bacterium]